MGTSNKRWRERPRQPRALSAPHAAGSLTPSFCQWAINDRDLRRQMPAAIAYIARVMDVYMSVYMTSDT